MKRPQFTWWHARLLLHNFAAQAKLHALQPRQMQLQQNAESSDVLYKLGKRRQTRVLVIPSIPY